MTLSRITGPSCPNCGCDSSQVKASKLWGQELERRQCDHCGTEFHHGAKSWPDASKAAEDAATVPAAVRYHILRCPACQSPNVKVTSTRGTIRHHKCADCGACFKSTEA